MLGLYDGSVNPAEALAAKEQSLTKDGTLSFKVLDAQSLALSTPEGKKDLQLHQYEIIKTDGSDLMKGTARGYMPLEAGYIEAQAVCKEAAQLPQAIPVLQAVSLQR